MNTEDALKKIESVHGKKYRLEEGWQYKNATSDITLFCPEHGEFHKNFYRLVNLKQGCPTCSYGKKVKPFGYWKDYDRCFEEAKKYRNKNELQKKNIGCYNAMARYGWLDEIADKIYDPVILYMQPHEKRNCVYVYEFKDLKTFYVGRTNNKKLRDKQHRNGYWHKSGERTFDNLYKFAKEHNVELPEPIYLEDNLTALESQEKEDFWKNKYIKDGWTTLNKGVTGAGKGSLGATVKWDYESCKKEASKYSSREELKKECQSCYTACKRNGWLFEFFGEGINKPAGYWESLENVLDAARKSSGARDMVNRFGGAYNAAKRNGWTKLLKYGTSRKED